MALVSTEQRWSGASNISAIITQEKANVLERVTFAGNINENPAFQCFLLYRRSKVSSLATAFFMDCC